MLRIFGWCAGPRGGQTGKGISERRGGTLTTYIVQESESLRAQNIQLKFGPTWWANRKRNYLEESRDYQLILYKSLRACVLRIISWCAGPRGWDIPEKESLRGEEGLSNYTVQESESLHAQNIRLMFGPTWWANRKRNRWEEGRYFINLYCTRVWKLACAEYSAEVRAYVVGKPEKKLLRGEQGLSTYTVQESESLRAQNILLMFGPMWWANRKKNRWEERRDYQIILYKSLESLRAQNIRLMFGPTWRGKTEKESFRGEETFSTYTVQESEGLRAQNILLMFGPTWWENRKRNHWEERGYFINLNCTGVESLRAQNIRLMFGPTWWANRKRISSYWPRQSWGQGWNPRRPSWWETMSGEPVNVQ